MSVLQSKKLGIAISYLMILANALSSIILVPVYLKYLGLEGYGFYQMIYAIASYILILDFGIGTTMVRFISEFQAQRKHESVENFASHAALFVLGICVVIFTVGLVISTQLGNIYQSLDSEQILLGQKMFIPMLFVLSLTMIEHYFEGIIMAHEYFSIAKLIGILKVGLRLLLTVLFLREELGVISIVYVDLIILLLAVIFSVSYVFGRLKFKIKFHFLDKSLLRSMFLFMAAIMLQSIVAYLNNTADKTIIGIMLGEKDSGIYGLSMTFITLFNMLPTAMLTIFLPVAVKLTIDKGENQMLHHTDLAIRIGRYQMIICGGILCAFIVLGRDFIQLWAGTDVDLIWLTALIIMIPNAIPLIQNYCLNVLDALNKRIFRSWVLLGLSTLNIVVTIILIKQWGIIGAPIATAIAYLIGHGVLMNIYYHKVIGLNIPKMWRAICHKIVPCILLTGILSIPMLRYEDITIVSFLIKCCIWGTIYIGLLWLMGLSQEEKATVISMIKRH